MEENPSNLQRSKQDSDNEKTPPHVWKVGFEKLCAFLDKHFQRIQTWATVIQTVIAVLMLATLVLGWRALVLSQRQFESTIEPVLDISYQQPSVDANFAPQTVTSYALGVPLDNMLTNVSHINFTNFPRTVFKNIGNVPISNLEIFMWMEVVFDEHLKVNDFIYTRDSKLISNKLAPDQSVTYNFSDEPTLQSLLKMSWQDVMHALYVSL
jgi:hypothetical protein